MDTNLTTSRSVIKREGQTIPFDVECIVRSVSLALFAARHGDIENILRHDGGLRYGLGEDDFARARGIARSVEWASELFYQKGTTPSSDELQDLTEKLLAAEGEFSAAKAYIIYRAHKNDARLNRYPSNGLQDYIFISRYARHNSHEKRRETWSEAVDRVRDMHLSHYADRLDPKMEVEVREAFEAVRRKEVLPSMRSLQFAGPAVLAHQARLFNCSYTHINRLRAFQETFYLLLVGCGVGFSVQKCHVGQLPPLAPRSSDDDRTVCHHHVLDTIEGWCDALGALINAYVVGEEIEFDFSAIRPRGSPLRTSVACAGEQCELSV